MSIINYRYCQLNAEAHKQPLDYGTGELYSQSIYNSKDFMDPVTFIYGHTYEYGSGLENEMFSSLHNFEDKDFFDTHEYFYVFTPDKILKYRIVSAISQLLKQKKSTVCASRARSLMGPFIE